MSNLDIAKLIDNQLTPVLFFAVQKNLFVHYRAIGQIEVAYYIMFAVCGLAYLVAWVVMHFLVPRMKPVNLS